MTQPMKRDSAIRPAKGPLTDSKTMAEADLMCLETSVPQISRDPRRLGTERHHVTHGCAARFRTTSGTGRLRGIPVSDGAVGVSP